ncbi:MAG: Phage-like element protein xkdM [Herbinix sp.]|jgi:hypothetical protein|nr:Phage-like element protein xkdM [Herbinix sp.]
MTGKRIMNGTWGEVWMDNEKVGECTGCQAKMSMTKEDVNICGRMAVDKKVTGISYTGSLTLNKVNSRMVLTIGTKIKEGIDPRFKIISKLDDPDAYGAERMVLKNVSFDDITLADWKAATMGSVEAPFTFTDYYALETVGA